jgi:hypothetical protein
MQGFTSSLPQVPRGKYYLPCCRCLVVGLPVIVIRITSQSRTLNIFRLRRLPPRQLLFTGFTPASAFPSLRPLFSGSIFANHCSPTGNCTLRSRVPHLRNTSRSFCRTTHRRRTHTTLYIMKCYWIESVLQFHSIVLMHVSVPY